MFWGLKSQEFCSFVSEQITKNYCYKIYSPSFVFWYVERDTRVIFPTQKYWLVGEIWDEMLLSSVYTSELSEFYIIDLLFWFKKYF